MDDFINEFVESLPIVKDELNGPLSDEFKKIYLDLTYGLELDVVFERLSKRVERYKTKGQIKKFQYIDSFDIVGLESKIKDVGDTFTLNLYETFLNYIDEQFKKSKERKKLYNIKETRKRTIVTSIGYITVNSTSYYNKTTKERFVLLREILNLKPYQR